MLYLGHPLIKRNAQKARLPHILLPAGGTAFMPYSKGTNSGTVR